MIFLFALTGFFIDDALAQRVIDNLLDIIPAKIVEPLEGEIRTLLAGPRHDLLTVSGFITLWTAFRGIKSLRNGLNRAYRLTEIRPFWWCVLQDLLLVLGGAVIVLVLALTLVFAPAIWAVTVSFFPALNVFTLQLELLRYLVGIKSAHDCADWRAHVSAGTAAAVEGPVAGHTGHNDHVAGRRDRVFHLSCDSLLISPASIPDWVVCCNSDFSLHLGCDLPVRR